MLPSLFLNSFSEGSYMQPPQLATPTVCPRKQLATFFILRIRSLEIWAGKNELKFWHPEPHQMQGWELLFSQTPPHTGSFANARPHPEHPPRHCWSKLVTDSWHAAAATRRVPRIFKGRRSWWRRMR